MPRLSLNKSAQLCGIARSTIQRAVHQGRLPRGTDGLIDTADLVRLGYLTPGREEDPLPPSKPITLRLLYETLVPLLTAISEQLARLLTLLEPEAGQPAARPKKRPPGENPHPCCP
jgi:hypothetical protein